jgi:hypothetical protein
MVTYQILSAASSTQAKAKPWLWPGFGSRLGLTILKAKATSGQARPEHHYLFIALSGSTM